MIVKLSKSEVKTLTSLDKAGKGARAWMTARAVGSIYFRKKEEKLEQPDIREIRNAFRKLVREDMVEISADKRGQYRITDKGRKLKNSGETEIESKLARGEVTKKKAAPKKTAKKSAARVAATRTSLKKAAKKATAKKATAKKVTAKSKKPAAPKRVSKKPPVKAKAKAKAPKVEVVDKTKESPEAAEAAEVKAKPANGVSKKPKFKRREALSYANQQK